MWKLERRRVFVRHGGKHLRGLIRWARKGEDKRLNACQANTPKCARPALHLLCPGRVSIYCSVLTAALQPTAPSPLYLSSISLHLHVLTDTVTASVYSLPVCTQTRPTFCKYPCVHTLRKLHANTPLHLCEIPSG